MPESTSNDTLARLRRFLLALAGIVFLGATAELWLIGHDESWLQWLPFVACALGVLAVGAVLWRPSRGVLRALRMACVAVTAVSLLGVYEHVAHNLAFELDIRPNAGWTDVWLEALGGASPMLAPGMLALGAVLAWAATYRHPAWRTEAAEPDWGKSA